MLTSSSIIKLFNMFNKVWVMEFVKYSYLITCHNPIIQTSGTPTDHNYSRQCPVGGVALDSLFMKSIRGLVTGQLVIIY